MVVRVEMEVGEEIPETHSVEKLDHLAIVMQK
jgi:hypothetical protein